MWSYFILGWIAISVDLGLYLSRKNDPNEDDTRYFPPNDSFPFLSRPHVPT